MLTSAFWVGALDRAVKSFAQTLLLIWGAGSGLDLLHVDFGSAISLGAGAAVLSVLTSIVSAPLGNKGSTSALPGAQ